MSDRDLQQEITLVDTSEAAKLLGLSPVTLRQWRSHSFHKGPRYYKLSPTLVRYSKSELASWLDQHAVNPEP